MGGQSGISWLLEGTGLTPYFYLSSFPAHSCSTAVLLSCTSSSLDEKGKKISITVVGALPDSLKQFFFFLFSETNVLNLALLALNSGDPSLFLFCETVLAYNLLIYLLKVRILG